MVFWNEFISNKIYLYLFNYISNQLDFYYEIDRKFFYKAPLHIAVEKGNIDVVQLLISNSGIRVNNKSVSKSDFCISFKQ